MLLALISRFVRMWTGMAGTMSATVEAAVGASDAVLTATGEKIGSRTDPERPVMIVVV